ncbi:Transglutaminase-like superfamily protein [Ekhidna lutea]|uniref:Transglutaminase-like superfamily protein n=1 Tax=Ekhidna lutea TaxID=447679 RepID=A0A239HMS5_EKHLU|nr:DUF3857 domain-containing protein [Ekhidna lutea]SNS81564.1 Transglutaminase-like superfamily protein [Ekhidna lutea]
MKNLISLFTLFFLFHVSIAQDINSRWGKVSKEELQMTQCPFDSTADAMVLSKTGELTFSYSDEKGWRYSIEVTKRVKIFNADGKSYGDISIKVYDPVSGNNREEIAAVKGVTYNLVGGKIDKTKLSNDMEFETRLSDYRSETSFAMPNVNEGSVIEYKYTLTSDYISNLYEWHFQEEIPVNYVKYRMTVPEFFIYSHNMVGNVISVETEQSRRDETITYMYTHMAQGAAPTKKQATMNSNSFVSKMEASKILALQDEPMMNNKSNLPSRIESQLIATDFPGQHYESVAQTYDDFSKTLISRSSFGGIIKRGGFAKEQIEALGGEDDETKMVKLYNWLRDDITFNNVYGFTSDNAKRKLIQSGEGTVADINLTLVSVLREAGFEAHPVILSTRGNGIPHPVYPNYEDFNYVIACIVKDDYLIYADAASSLPFGVLPSRCLNGKGWLVKEVGSQWIDLKTNTRESYVVQSDISVSEGTLNRKTLVKFDDYALYRQRGAYLKDKEEYSEKLANNFTSENVTVDVEDEEGLRLQIESSNELGEDFIYLDPFQYGVIKENPFKRDTRFSNVDFPYGSSRKVIVNLEIPEGYTIEIPEATAIALPNGGGRFVYTVQKNGNRVTILSQFLLKQTIFSAEEYPVLKQFYQLMADKNSEPVVLQKI